MSFLKKISKIFSIQDDILEIDLNGVWRGFYKYNANLHHLLQHKKFDFILQMTEEEDGLLHGFFEEELIQGEIDDQINFLGERKGKKIKFNKFYNSCYIMGDDGVLYKDENNPSPLVKYQGHYYLHEHKFIGDWCMEYQINGLKQQISGMWEMRKE